MTFWTKLQNMKAKHLFFAYLIFCHLIINDSSRVSRSSQYFPTCHDAYSVCRLDPDCFSNYHHFKKSCRIKKGVCQMRNRDLCRSYLTKIQRTPLYGCVCNSQHGDRCGQIYVSTNQNPCVDIILKSEFSQKPKPPRISPPYRGTYDGGGSGTKPDSIPDVDMNQEQIFSSNEDGGGSKLDIMDGYRRDGNGIILTTIHYPISHESGMRPPSSSEQQTDDTSNGEQISSELDPSAMNSKSWPRFHLYQKFSWKIESTCPTAVINCRRDALCRRLLQQLLRQCETLQISSSFNRTSCMSAVQELYQHGPHELVQGLAFCICKQTDDVCVEQQRTVLPVCAEMSDNRYNRVVPTCNQVIEECRIDNQCGSPMNIFVDACATNSSSHGCLHSPSRCRSAILNILGTKLRTRCTCPGGDYKSHYMCLDWQRLLWLNPCVVQALFDFHSKLISSGTKSEPARPAAPSSVITAPVTTRLIWSAKNNVHVVSTPKPYIFQPKTTTRKTIRPFYRKSTIRRHITTTTTVATIIQSKPIIQHGDHCKWSSFTNSKNINTETKFRVFKDLKQRCSSVCSCDSKRRMLCQSPSQCNKAKPCSTDSASYHHASSAYLAKRGHCVCFSGTFVCTDPMKETPTPKRGLFLYTGYSEEDRKNVKYQIKAKDAFVKFEAILNRFPSKEKCKLSLVKQVENIIIFQAYLSDEGANLKPSKGLSQTAEEPITLDGCLRSVEKLANYVNNKKPNVPYDLSLSIFKIAKVVTLIKPEARSNNSTSNIPNGLSTLLSAVLILICTAKR